MNRGVKTGLRSDPFLTSTDRVYTIDASGTKRLLPDPTKWPKMRIKLTANCAFTMPTAVVGQKFTLALEQGTTGGWLATFDSSVIWLVPPLLTTVPGKVDYLTFFCTIDGVWDGLTNSTAAEWNVVTKTADYAPADHEVVVFDATSAPITATISHAANFVCIVARADTSGNSVLLQSTVGGVDGGTENLDGQYQARMLIGTGSAVRVIGERKPFGPPAALGGAAAPGVSWSMARADHVHDTTALQFISALSGVSAGSAHTFDLAGAASAIIGATLNSASCAITVTGFPSSPHDGVLILNLQQDSTGGRAVTWVDTIVWVEGYPPRIAQGIAAITSVSIWSDDGGTTKYGSHGQKIRTHRLNLSGALTDSYVGKIRERIEGDFRIVKVWVEVGDAPVSTASVFDVNINGTTAYTTQANRPSVAATAHEVIATLPDVVNGTAGQYLTADCDTASSAGYAQVCIMCVETV